MKSPFCTKSPLGALNRKLIATALGLALLAPPLAAMAEERRGEGGHMQPNPRERMEDRRDRHDNRRDDKREDRRDWHYERNHGWRYERGPGVWSPFFLWWWIDGRSELRAAPTQTVIAYQNGQYELRGDGYRVPYYWVWIPAIPSPPPAPPPVYAPYPEPGGAPMPPPPPGAPQGYPQGVPQASGQSRDGNKDVAGMVIGGVVGGALGGSMTHGRGRTTGVIIGTLLGALVGHEIGKSLDEADELRTVQVLERNKIGERATWTNQDNGAQVMVVPQRDYKSEAGEYCREYQTEITVGGEKRQAYGKACRQPDGQWKIVN